MKRWQIVLAVIFVGLIAMASFISEGVASVITQNASGRSLPASALWHSTRDSLWGAVPAIMVVVCVGIFARRVRLRPGIVRMLKGGAFSGMAFVVVYTSGASLLRSLSLRTNLDLDNTELFTFGIFDAWYVTLKGIFLGAMITMAVDAPPINLRGRRKNAGESVGYLDDAGVSGKILLLNWAAVLALAFVLIFLLG